MRQILQIILFFSAALSLASCSSNDQPETTKAEAGIIDLRGKPTDRQDIGGQWEYYHQKFYEPADFKNSDIRPDTFLTLPSIWNVFSLNGEAIPSNNYATYRLKILTDTERPILMLKGRPQSTSYKLWVGDSLLAQAGVPGKSKSETQAKLMPFRKTFSLKETAQKNGNYYEFYITVQIANYSHVNGGPWWTYYLGSPEEISRAWFKQVSLSLLSAGFIFIMALYHFILFFLQRKNYSYLFFGLMSLSLVLRILSTNERLLLAFFPELSAGFIMRTEYISAYSNVLFLPYFFFAIFKNEYHKIMAYLFAAMFLFTLITVGFMPVKVFTGFKDVYNMSLMLGSVYILFILLPRALYRKRSGVWIALFGLAAMVSTSVYDMILASRDATTGNYIAPYGLIVFIMAQSFVLAKRFSNTFKEAERLSDELDFKNQNLEAIVKKRTEKIEYQKLEISEKNEELQQQNEEISAQKEEVEQSRVILEKRNEQTQKSLTYAATIQKAILPLKDMLSERFEHFVIFKPKDIVSGDFYWTSFFHPQYVFIAVVDCTGHGVPGSFMSMIGSHMLREIVNERQLFEPAEILEAMDKEIALTLQQESTLNKDGMDLALCRFERLQNGKRNVVYSGAKIPLYHYSSADKTVERIKATRRSIGGLLNTKKDFDFEQKELCFKENDIIYLTTDGYLDQNNPARKKISSVGFSKLLEEIAEKPLEEQKAIMLGFINKWQNGSPQRDDITVMGLKM